MNEEPDYHGEVEVMHYLAFLRDLPDLQTLEDYRPALTTTVLDRNSVPIAEFYEYRRRVIPLSEVSQRLGRRYRDETGPARRHTNSLAGYIFG